MKKFIPILSYLFAFGLADRESRDLPDGLPVGLHAEYVLPGSEERIQLWLPEHDGPVKTKQLTTAFVPTVHYERRIDHSGLYERDICAYITDCAGRAYSTAAAWGAVAKVATVTTCQGVAGAVSDYLTENNYANTKDIIIKGVVVGIAVNLASVAPGYWINAKLEATNADTNGRNDICGEKDPKTFSGNAASAVYEFCLSIQKEQKEQATANFDTLDTTDGNGNNRGGFQGRAKLFISEQAATWGDICRNDYGIDWKAKMRRTFGGLTAN
ncbi:hypothetical protein VFPPC_10488 [Pochonia chlamydosporia 170]|uniref:Uncharacterized protein n=1 Tax=Pochonia chlamydosporia 170 TaxID=1380566 RepID=A0A179F2A2_METCM|nr:hypothetical protein VFPPC_10488 [Pochonia chlamydosporia 170]OAQ59430.1 hypothetical protein VFPPC_10488 [Pochonia chlamydosporia 170]